MGVDRFRKALRLFSIACLIEAAACGLVVGDLPEPASDPLNPGQGGTGGSAGAGGSSAGESGNGGNDAGGGSAGQSGSGGQDGASGDAGTSALGAGGVGGTGGDGGTAGTSGAGQGGTAGSGVAAGSGGTAGRGGSAGSSGSAGSGGSAGSSGTAGRGGTAGTGAAGSGGVCDADGDMARALSCGGPDCDDANSAAKPGQVNWFETARIGGSFDYNCNNLEEREFPTVTVCSLTDLTNCLTKPAGWLDPAPICGGKGNWGKCKHGGVANLDCVPDVITVDKVMRCH